MGKTRIIIEKCATRFRTELHGKLDTLPPKARLAVIAGMLVLRRRMPLYDSHRHCRLREK